MSYNAAAGTPPPGYPAYQQPPRKKNTGLIIAIILVLLLLAGGAVYYFLVLKKDNNAGGETIQSGEIFLASAESFGDDPYSDVPFATGDCGDRPCLPGQPGGPTLSAPNPPAASTPAKTTITATPSSTPPTKSGNEPGLYGGTMNMSTCDVDAMIKFLQANTAKAQAWVDAQNADPAVALPDGSKLTVANLGTYLKSLTSVVLTADTRVTNHGYKNGKANQLQSVLEKGTAVLVDNKGVPRAKCYCGNPLIGPKTSDAGQPITYKGDSWANFSTTNIVNIQASTTVINTFTLTDIRTGELFDRPAGSTGGGGGETPKSGGTATTPAGTTVPSAGTTQPSAGTQPNTTSMATGTIPTKPGNPNICLYTPSQESFSDTYEVPIGESIVLPDGTRVLAGPGCAFGILPPDAPVASETPVTSEAPATSADNGGPGPQPNTGPNECAYNDAGDGHWIVAAKGSTFTDTNNATWFVNDDCELTYQG